MSVQSEITRLANAKTALATAIEGKGVTVPEGTKLDGMAALVEAISAGGGGAVYTFGTFILSSDTNTNGYVIEHSLGVVPQIFILFPKHQSSVNYALNGCTIWEEGLRQAGYTASKYAYVYSNRGYNYTPRGGISTNQSLTVDESSITLPDFSLALMPSNLAYYWIAIGGIPV